MKKAMEIMLNFNSPIIHINYTIYNSLNQAFILTLIYKESIIINGDYNDKRMV